MTGRRDRVKAVVEFGFTERQARFLVTVMLHSGVCLLRQYTAFAGIVHGQKTRKFFAKLVRRGFATAYPCRHNRGRVYHVHHKPLYRAIGETDSRHRRPMSAARVVESADAARCHARQPRGCMARDRGGEAGSPLRPGGHQPRRSRASTRLRVLRGQRSRAPRSDADRHRSGWPVGVRLRRRRRPARGLPPVRPAPCVPARRAAGVDASGGVRIASRLARRAVPGSALSRSSHSLWPEVVNHIRGPSSSGARTPWNTPPIDDQESYDEAHFAFKATRFQVLYRRWLSEGDTAFEVISSGAAGRCNQARRRTGRMPRPAVHISPSLTPGRPSSSANEGGRGGG